MHNYDIIYDYIMYILKQDGGYGKYLINIWLCTEVITKSRRLPAGRALIE